MKRTLIFLTAAILCMMLAGATLADGYPMSDFDRKTVTLNSGYEMPILGLGMFSLSDSEAENSTYWALKAGFRLIDTARIYGNEAAVGRGLRRAIDEGIVTREEVFITTKMWTSDFSNGDVAIDASLQRLGVDYIDLMILHHSQPRNDVEAYQAMERAVADRMPHSFSPSRAFPRFVKVIQNVFHEQDAPVPHDAKPHILSHHQASQHQRRFDDQQDNQRLH